MNKNRIGYILLMACLAVLVFLYSKPFLLFVLIVLAVLVVWVSILSHVDAANLKVELQILSGVQEGKDLKLLVKIHSASPLYVARSLLIGMDIENTMFQSCERKYYFMYLSGRENEVELTLPAQRCGEMKITCADVLLQDILKLFRRKVKSFETVETVIYPHGINVHVEMSRATIGAPRDEGKMQNRRGNDQSEMFDIREYVPGDDIRSIHWKLSSKTDQLILREPSDPSHYNMILLPDIGRKENGTDVPIQEINTAVAFGAAIGEQLMRLGCNFCMAIPTGNGLYLHEVRDRRDFRQMMAYWLGCPIPEESGQALQYFITEHMDQHFTRLLILSAGIYRQNINVLNDRIGTTVVSARADLETLSTTVSGSGEIIEIPVEKSQEMYRIIC